MPQFIVLPPSPSRCRRAKKSEKAAFSGEFEKKATIKALIKGQNTPLFVALVWGSNDGAV